MCTLALWRLNTGGADFYSSKEGALFHPRNLNRCKVGLLHGHRGTQQNDWHMDAK